jgi:hypothetical protein
MDVVKAVQGYITKIVNGTTGIKVLLLDNHTVLSSVPSVGYTDALDSHNIRRHDTIDTPQP